MLCGFFLNLALKASCIHFSRDYHSTGVAAAVARKHAARAMDLTGEKSGALDMAHSHDRQRPRGSSGQGRSLAQGCEGRPMAGQAGAAEGSPWTAAAKAALALSAWSPARRRTEAGPGIRATQPEPGGSHPVARSGTSVLAGQPDVVAASAARRAVRYCAPRGGRERGPQMLTSRSRPPGPSARMRRCCWPRQRPLAARPAMRERPQARPGRPQHGWRA